MSDLQKEYNELSLYTLSLNDKGFIHQNIVDTFIAQNADSNTKNIALFFSVIGLYLYIEKGYSGKEIQDLHTKIANTKKELPKLKIPKEKATITISNVLEARSEIERNEKIKEWSASVWEIFKDQKDIIENFLREY